MRNAVERMDGMIESLPHDSRGDTLGVVEHEPLAVAEGRSLVRSLIEEPCTIGSDVSC
jgi:hypothetical protein